MSNVRIWNGALDEHEGKVVLRGSLDPATLDAIQMDDYQREIRSVSALNKIMSGFESGSAVPDVELGMRGVRKSYREGVYTLLDPVFVIDGLQRISAAKIFASRGGIPHLGAEVHFGTEKSWERRLFKILNADRTRVSGNIIFRNSKEDFEAVRMLHSMNDDSGFVLRGRISWNQALGRNHLITGFGLGKVITMLHSFQTGISGASASGSDLGKRVQTIYDLVGKNILRANVKTYYELIEECWGLKTIAFKEKAPQLRSTFQMTLACLLANCNEFWRENRLLIEAPLRRKFAGFPIFDPTVIQLSSAGSKTDRVLYDFLKGHINSGKRTKRLTERRGFDNLPTLEDPDDNPGQ